MRRILIGCYEVAGYGGASSVAYRLLEELRAAGLDASLVNLVDEQDAEFFRFVFGPSWGNPSSLTGVTNHVLAAPLYGPQTALADLIHKENPDVTIGVGFIGALLMKRAAPQRRSVFLTTGCQALKNAIARGQARDYLEIKRLIDRGIARPRVSDEEREAMEIADLVVVHSEMIRRLCGFYYPNHEGKIVGGVLWFARWIYEDALTRSAMSRPFAERDVDVLFVASSWRRPEKNHSFVKKIAAGLAGARVHVVGETKEIVKGATHHGLIADRNELFALMGRSRAIVSPSLFDSAPGILFEAAALGCNIVASENCGNWMICDERLLVQSFTPDDFVAKAAAATREKYAKRIGHFLDPAPWNDFLETLDVL